MAAEGHFRAGTGRQRLRVSEGARAPVTGGRGGNHGGGGAAAAASVGVKSWAGEGNHGGIGFRGLTAGGGRRWWCPGGRGGGRVPAAGSARAGGEG